MNHRHDFPRFALVAGHKARHGFTLIELMVAMLLGLIVIAGVASVFLANLRSYHTNEALSDVQSNSRIAFALMSRDIRGAGLTGCNSFTGRLTNVLNNQATTWWANWNNNVRGYDDSSQDPAIKDLTGSGAPVAGINSLQIISAGTGAVATSNYYDGVSDKSFVLQSDLEGLANGDVVMVCDPGHAAIFQATTYAGKTITFTATGLNDSVGLGFPSAFYTAACDTGTGINCFPPNSLVSKLSAVDWYIGVNLDGGRSLYQVNNRDANPVEMVRGVTGMTITYHQADGVNKGQFTNATTVTNWGQVDAVRIALVLQSADQRASTDVKPLVRTFQSTTNLRNRVH